MILAMEDKKHEQERNAFIYDLIKNETNFQKWTEHPSSVILHHDCACCEEAKLWFLAYARSMEMWSLSQFHLNAPTWLSQLFTWGPSQWPIFWCEVVKEKIVDCGVFSALCREIFRAQGYEVHPAQALLNYNETCTDHWKDLWKKRTDLAKKKEIFPWIGSRIVYHELCVLEMPNNTAKFYDSTFGIWYEPHPRVGFAALLALRAECPRILNWNNKSIGCGEWIDI